jgi:hypothetical protein
LGAVPGRDGDEGTNDGRATDVEDQSSHTTESSDRR